MYFFSVFSLSVIQQTLLVRRQIQYNIYFEMHLSQGTVQNKSVNVGFIMDQRLYM